MIEQPLLKLCMVLPSLIFNTKMKGETVSHYGIREGLGRHATHGVGSTDEKTLPEVDNHVVGCVAGFGRLLDLQQGKP